MSSTMATFFSCFFLSVEGVCLYVCFVTVGTETILAESVKGQPPEPAGGGGETFQCSVQAVHHGQAGPRETRAEW